jgi:hypothetical protein
VQQQLCQQQQQQQQQQQWAQQGAQGQYSSSKQPQFPRRDNC